MAVAFEALARLLHDRQIDVRRVSTSPNSLHPSAAYHLQRIVRVLGALVALARLRVSSSTVVVSVDAGLGMVYGIAIVCCSRALRFTVYVQHHSYAYLHRPSRLMRAFTRVAGTSTHLCSCDQMAAALRSSYACVDRTLVVPVSYTMRTEGTSDHRLPADSAPNDRPWRIGHFGNLSVEKGLSVAIATISELASMEVAAELVLAGPIADPEDRRLVERALATHAENFSWVGPIYGPDRDEYLAGLDLLLFPSRYAHESFGLAAWEALAMGTPIIAYRAGCLTQAAVGDGGIVLDPHEDFSKIAAHAVRHLDASRLARMRQAGMAAARQSVQAGLAGVDGLARELVSGRAA